MKDFQLLIYSTPAEDVKVDVVLKDENIWATQKAMALLFGCTPDNVSLHLKNIFESGELKKEATTEFFSAVQLEGNRMVERVRQFYSLDAIIAVGYRVSSARATAFRIWSTGILKEYIRKGFVLDDNPMKNGGADRIQKTPSSESCPAFRAPLGTRTLDPLIKSQLLYQLS